jgi:AcrR family transcriptional regulator
MNVASADFRVIKVRMNVATPKRVYRQSARALAAEATGERILDAFANQLRERWFDEIRLEEVAREAGVTIQTVIRRFSSKEGLLDAMHQRLGSEIRQRREVEAGDVDGAIASLIEDYEEVGDLVMRTLAQEDRYAAVMAITDIGRSMHREWISKAFKPWLDGMSRDDRRRATDALVVAGDIYVWKLVRKDMKRPVAEYQALMETMCAAAVGLSPEQIFTKPAPGDAQ